MSTVLSMSLSFSILSARDWRCPKRFTCAIRVHIHYFLRYCALNSILLISVWQWILIRYQINFKSLELLNKNIECDWGKKILQSEQLFVVRVGDFLFRCLPNFHYFRPCIHTQIISTPVQSFACAQSDRGASAVSFV